MASILFPSQLRLCCIRDIVVKIPKSHERGASKPSHLAINNHKTSTFTYTSADDVPLLEFPEASFDEYMEDKGRLIRAIIPEKATSQQLNQEEWRIRMPVIQAFFLTTQPVVDIRVRSKCNGEDYPLHIPHHITKILELHTTKWELQGLHADYMPPLFNLEATGTLYPERQATHSCIKNQLNTNISLVFPTLLSWVPEYAFNNIIQSVIEKIMDDIKQGYTVRLLADYRSFKTNKSKNLM